MTDLKEKYVSEVEIICKDICNFYTNGMDFKLNGSADGKAAITPLAIESISPLKTSPASKWRPALSVLETVGGIFPVQVHAICFGETNDYVVTDVEAEMLSNSVTAQIQVISVSKTNNDIVFSYRFSFTINKKPYIESGRALYEKTSEYIRNRYGDQITDILPPVAIDGTVIPNRELATVYGKFSFADYSCIFSIAFPVFNRGGLRAESSESKRLSFIAKPMLTTVEWAQRIVEQEYRRLTYGGTPFFDVADATDSAGDVVDIVAGVVNSAKAERSWLATGLNSFKNELKYFGTFLGVATLALEIGGAYMEIQRTIADATNDEELDKALKSAVAMINSRSNLSDRIAMATHALANALVAIVQIDAVTVLKTTRGSRTADFVRTRLQEFLIDSVIGFALGEVLVLAAAGALTGGVALVVIGCVAGTTALAKSAYSDDISNQKKSALSLKREDFAGANGAALRNQSLGFYVNSARTLLASLYSDKKGLHKNWVVMWVPKSGFMPIETQSLKPCLYRTNGNHVSSRAQYEQR